MRFSIIIFLTLAACGGQGGKSADSPAGKAPGFDGTYPLSGSPIVGSTWRGQLTMGVAPFTTATDEISFDESGTFTSSHCHITWKVSGMVDKTFAAPGQAVQIELVSVNGAYNSYCLRPENSPYQCNMKRYFDPGLNKWFLAIESCGQGFSNTVYSN